MDGNRAWGRSVFAAIAVLGLTACGGGSDSPTSPTPDGSGPTITIGSDGRVSPANVTVSPGSRVTFVNNHNLRHDMASDPHPEHSDCPEINQVGTLAPGQTGRTGNLNTVRTCGFHDHDNPGNTGLQGTIRIQ
jgi:plastocyanin